MKKSFILMAIAVFVAGITLSCCSPEKMAENMAEKIIEKSIESEGGGDVDIDLSGKGKLPADFPKELKYPGAKVVGSFSINTGEGKGSSVAMETSASASRVVKHYKGLTKKGWKSEVAFSGMGEDGTEGSMLGLSKGNFSAMVTIGEEDGKTSIAVIYGIEE